MTISAQGNMSGRESRRGASPVGVLVFVIVTLVVVVAAIDLGHVVWVRTQLQEAADSAALGAAATMGQPRTEMLNIAEELAACYEVGGEVLAYIW